MVRGWLTATDAHNFPVLGNEFTVLVKAEPVELQVHLGQSDALWVPTILQNQSSSS